MIFITHDFGVVAEIADKVLVMYAGRCVESGSVRDVFYNAQHPYTWGLLASIPAPDRPRTRRLPSIKGDAAVADQPAEGLRLQPPVRLRVRPLPRGNAAGARADGHAGARRCVLAREPRSGSAAGQSSLAAAGGRA